MGLTDLFSKLIVEHGSAEVQSKHIALFKDQLMLADKKITALETENTALKSKFENAETTIQKLTKENEELRSKIQKYEHPSNQPSHSDSLEEIKVSILLFMSKYEETFVGNVASSLGIGIQTAQFHLEELQEANMVDASYFMGGETSWYLAQGGRKYLVRNNLIT